MDNSQINRRKCIQIYLMLRVLPSMVELQREKREPEKKRIKKKRKKERK